MAYTVKFRIPRALNARGRVHHGMNSFGQVFLTFRNWTKQFDYKIANSRRESTKESIVLGITMQ